MRQKGSGAVSTGELRRVQAAHVLTNTLRHNNRMSWGTASAASCGKRSRSCAPWRRTHGDVEKDVAERETVIREPRRCRASRRGAAARRVLTIARGETALIRSRVREVAARRQPRACPFVRPAG